MDFRCFDEEELREDLGVTDTHLDYLDKALQAIKVMEEVHPGALALCGTEEDREGEIKVDAIAMVLERCRPGRVQQILGKTKLQYFSAERILFTPGISESGQGKIFGKFSNTAFAFPSIVRTAMLQLPGKDAKGREYLHIALFKDTPPAKWTENQTIGDALKFEGMIYLFEDGSFAKALPTETKDEAEVTQPKKRGLLRRFLR